MNLATSIFPTGSVINIIDGITAMIKDNFAIILGVMVFTFGIHLVFGLMRNAIDGQMKYRALDRASAEYDRASLAGEIDPDDPYESKLLAATDFGQYDRKPKAKKHGHSIFGDY